jgi:hypothetical protein
MEPNSTNDRFEEFLRKSLQNYEENPPEQAWQAIQSRVPAPTLGMSNGGRKRGLAIAASVCLLLSAFGAQHYYFNQKLREAQTQIDARKLEINEMNKFWLEQEHKINDLQAIISKNSSTTEAKTFENPAQSSSFSGLTTGQQRPLKVPPLVVDAHMIATAQQMAAHAQNPSEAAAAAEDAIIQQIHSSNGVHLPLKPEAKSSNTTTIGTLTQIGAYPQIARLQSTSGLAPQINRNIVAVSTPKSTLSVRAYSMVGTTQQEVTIKPTRRNSPADFAKQDYTKQGSIWQAGVQIKKQVSPRVAVFGGLATTHLTQHGMHQIKLKPRHHGGQGQGGPHQNDSLSFSYTIQLGSGVADVELRAVDSSNMQHNDDVDIQLATLEKTKYLSVPIGAQLKLLQKGRLSLHLESGLTLQIPTSRNLQIENLDFTAPFQIKPEPNQRHNARVRTQGPNPLDIWWSASPQLGFTLNRRCKIDVSPVLFRKANRSLEHGWAEHRLVGSAVQFGLSYQL